MKLPTLLALTAGSTASSPRRHRLQPHARRHAKLSNPRNLQVNADMSQFLVSAALGPCDGPAPTTPYAIGDLMEICISTFDPATVTALTSVTATPSGGSSKDLVDSVGDAALGTSVSGLDSSKVTLSSLVTLQYYYEAISSGETAPMLVVQGSATVDNSEVGFEVDVPFDADVDLASLGSGITTPAPSELCSCSPTSYEFTLDSSRDCETNTLEGKDGILVTLCLGGNAGPVTVTSVQFLEFDTSGNLVVIHQDDSLYETSLTDGESFSFASISANLDSEVPIEEQLDRVPGGVQLTLRGTDESGAVVTERITWAYTNGCDAEPVVGGDEFGWVTMEPTPASSAFCPAVAVETTAAATTEKPETTVESATTVAPTTEAAETTVEPTTAAPETTVAETTAAATTAEPVETTEAPEMSMSMSMSMSAPATTAAPEETTVEATTTEAPADTTAAPEMSVSMSMSMSTPETTVAATTEAPEETTETPEDAATEAPESTVAAATEAPEMSMPEQSMSMLFGKSGKTGKATKTFKEAKPKTSKADPKAGKVEPEDRPSAKASKVPKGKSSKAYSYSFSMHSSADSSESESSEESAETSSEASSRSNRMFEARYRANLP